VRSRSFGPKLRRKDVRPILRRCIDWFNGAYVELGASESDERAKVLAVIEKMAEFRPGQTDRRNQAAFQRYEDLRRPRAAEVVRLTARNSSQKRSLGRWQLLIRDLLLRVFIPLGIRTGRKLFVYRPDQAPFEFQSNAPAFGAARA
jgi:hypothetical protein